MPSRGSAPDVVWRGQELRARRFAGHWGARWHEGFDPDFERRQFGAKTPAWLRLWLPVVVSFLVQVPGVFIATRTGQHPELTDRTGPEIAFHLALALVGPIALIFARRFPGPVVAIVALAAAADLLTASDFDGPPYIAFAFAIGSAIVRGARVWAWISIAASWLGTLVFSWIVGATWQPWRVVGISFGILILVAISEGIRTGADRRAQMRRMLENRRQSEVQKERVRIARELHDVLAHSLSQINVQAGVGLHLIDKNPDKAAEALASIKSTSKSALDEVRSVLGILRAEGGADPTAPLVPEPDLERLAGLAASVTSQGIDVVLDQNAGSELPKPIQLAVYRIVQESLTNVVRHAHATRATVTIAETGGVVTVDIVDNGTGATATRERGSEVGGRGLLGMRERAELLGGSLESGPRPDGGFAVSARIPHRSSDTPGDRQ